MLKVLLMTTLLATPALAQTMPGMENMEGMQMNDTAQAQTLEGAMGSSGMGMDMGNSGEGTSGMGGMGGSGMGGGMHGGSGGMQGMEGMEGMMKMMSGMMQMMQMMQSMQGMMNSGEGGTGMNMGSGAGMQGMGAGMGAMAGNAMTAGPLTEAGQSAFATIAEVVRALDANPNTDWSMVDIDALRQHLQDMDRVTLDSFAVAEKVDGGMKFTVTGDATVAPSIERMVLGHAAIMDGTDGWSYSAEIVPNGAEITVLVPESDLAKLEGLGFYGLLASGPHHQPHHWAMANGKGMGN